jgi:RNA polymerase sigma factor (sigma-70 family)
MNHEPSDQWIGRLNQGDVTAVERVFQAYEPYLRVAIRRRLSPRLRPKVDSGDIVQSVFADLVRGVRDVGWHFAGRPQLEAFLRRIAWRRLADCYQRHERALEQEHSLDETPSQSLGDATQARPSQEAQGREVWEDILRACPPAHHDVVRLRMHGHRMGEIAARTGMHEGSVRRILYELARRLSIARRSAVTDNPAQGSQHATD